MDIDYNATKKGFIPPPAQKTMGFVCGGNETHALNESVVGGVQF